MARNKFTFGDVVKVLVGKKKKKDFTGRKGVVVGIGGIVEYSPYISYSVAFFDERDEMEEVRGFDEHELEATNEPRVDISQFYTGESIRVAVDPRTGKGSIVYDERGEDPPGTVH